MKLPHAPALLIPALMLLAGSAPHAGAFQLKLFPASAVYDPDTEILHEHLGLKGQPLKVEDFENRKLQGWLHTDLQGGGGEGTDRTAWAGNLASSFADSAFLEINLPGVRLLGIGLADNDGGTERVSINGEPAVGLAGLPGHVIDSRTRAYYLIIEAEPEDPSITSVSFDHCFTVHFDHLVVLQGKEPQKEEKLRPRLVLDLIDGTRLVGYVSDNLILASTENGPRSDLSLDRIHSMQLAPGSDAATVLLSNGQKASGRTRFSALRITTILGDLSVAREKIRQIKVSFRGQYRPGPKVSSRPPALDFYAPEPSLEGKSLRAWLQDTGPRPRGGNMYDLLAPDADAKSAQWQAADRAIREIGLEAIPFLIEMLTRADQDLQDAHRAVRGFEALGELARTALPDLMLLLDNPDEMVHVCTVWAIGRIGPAAKTAVPVLLEELLAGFAPAAEALGNIGSAAAQAAPAIIAKLRQGDEPYDLPFIIALGRIGSKEAVPVLMEIAEGTDRASKSGQRGSSDAMRKHRAVEALGKIGPGAGPAVPMLVRLLKQQGSGNVAGLYFTDRIIRALGAVGPDAKEALPVLHELAAWRNLTSSIHGTIAQSATAAIAGIQPTSK